MFEPSLLTVILFDQEILRFWLFSVGFHWSTGVGFPVAEHDTVTSESEADAGITDAVTSDTPGKSQH